MTFTHIPACLHSVVQANGYTEVREVPGQGWCGLLQFLLTWSVVVDLTEDCYGRRYCYEHQEDAAKALKDWNGQGHPTGPWVKCKGAGIDFLNPDLELV